MSLQHPHESGQQQPEEQGPPFDPAQQSPYQEQPHHPEQPHHQAQPAPYPEQPPYPAQAPYPVQPPYPAPPQAPVHSEIPAPPQAPLSPHAPHSDAQQSPVWQAAPGVPAGYAAPPVALAPGVLPARAPIGGLSIASFVVSFFAGLIGVVLGVCALRQNWVRGTRGNVLAWAGIILGAIFGVAQVWLAILMFWVASNSMV